MVGIHRFVSWPLLAAALVLLPASPRPALAQQRTYSAGQFVLELDGASAGVLRDVEGGEAVADVITAPGPGGVYVNKHVASVKYADFVLEAGAGMEPAFYDWIAATWDGKLTRKSGAVLMVDYNSQVVARREFRDALLSEIALPTLDGASKDPGYLTVRIAPTSVRLSKGGGSVPTMSVAKAQRPWTVNNYRLEIAGLDCSRVRKIESFTVKQKVVDSASGSDRDLAKVPGALTFSNLVVTLPEMYAETWDAWAQNAFVGGMSDDSQEKVGDLVLLGSDGQSEIARIHLSGLGIISVSHQSAESANQMRSVVATLYCERAALEWKGGTGAVMNVRVFGR
jgi:hypothetical protein